MRINQVLALMITERDKLNLAIKRLGGTARAGQRPQISVLGAKGGKTKEDSDILAAVERLVISRVLETTDGNTSQSARVLGIRRDKLRYKIKKHNLQARRSSAGKSDRIEADTQG